MRRRRRRRKRGLDGRVLGREMRLVRGKSSIYSRQEKVEKVGMVGGLTWEIPGRDVAVKQKYKDDG